MGMAVSPLNFLLFAGLHTNELLLELFRNLSAVQRNGATFTCHMSSALDVFNINGNDIALFGGALLLCVFIGSLIAQKCLDLTINLGIGCFFRRHGDGRCVIRIKLCVRADVKGYLIGVILALLYEIIILAIISPSDGNKIKLFKYLRLCRTEKIIGCLSKHCIIADNAINNRTRCFALTKTLEGILISNVFVSLLNRSVNVCSRNGDLNGKLLIFWLVSGNGDVQRSSSVSNLYVLDVPAAFYVARGAGGGNRTPMDSVH